MGASYCWILMILLGAVRFSGREKDIEWLPAQGCEREGWSTAGGLNADIHLGDTTGVNMSPYEQTQI